VRGEIKDGKSAMVEDNKEEYQNVKPRIELLEILAEAGDDVKDGRVEPISSTFADLRKILL
jgi:hypothetical protein